MTLRSLSFFAALSAAGCGGSDVTSGGSDAGDASTQDGGGVDSSAIDSGAIDSGVVDSSDAAVACNTLVNSAPVLPLSYVATAPPSPQGGPIMDGTYLLTAAAIYTGVGGQTGATGGSAQVTIKITGTTVQVANKAMPPGDHLTTTLVPNGTSFTRTDTCPDTMSQQGAYTATATTFIAILPAGNSPDGGARTLVETFTKQ